MSNIERTEYEVPAGEDARMEVLGALAGSAGMHGWVFVQVAIDDDGGLNLKLECGGIVQSGESVKALLEQTLRGLR